MVTEILKYKAPSAVLELEQVKLEPELTQLQPYFMAEIVDSELVMETFCALHLVTATKTGRIPGHEARVRYRYDPIITVDNGFVDFETFSLDMCYYAKARFFENAFKNIEQWENGVTNIDFSKPFIKQLKESSGLKNIFVDPEEFELLSDTGSIIEKKIPLPDNWKIGLENIKKSMADSDSKSSQNLDYNVLAKKPFKRYLSRFANVTKFSINPNGWHFIELEMRNNLGSVQIAVTSNKLERIDGRKNINYDLIRAARDLRALKSYYLEVECLEKETYRVVGGHEPHIIRRIRNRLVCDCGDYVHRGNTNCKHIRALNRPKFLVVQVGNTNWIVSDGNREYKIEYRDNTFFCECGEFHQTNICPHLVEVLKLIDDYQFGEVKLDLS